MKQNKTLCWICQKAGGLCSWSKNFTPVEGWEAIPTEITSYTTGGTKRARERIKVCYGSYNIIKCPEFELLETVKLSEIERAKWLDLIARNMSKSDTNT